jgi:hypothetical protein
LYQFTSYEQEYGYFAYRDTATQRMLIASAGGTYGIEAVDPAFPVPPADGRWNPLPVKAAAKTAAKGSTGEAAPASTAGGEN